MLGPPNSGSHIARRLAASLGRFCPPLHELSDAPDSYVNRLDQPTGIDLGIIAAESDRVVKLTSTFLECRETTLSSPDITACCHGGEIQPNRLSISYDMDNSAGTR